MEIQVRKNDLIEFLNQLEDENLLTKLESVINSHKSAGDWWNELPQEAQDGINEGISQLDKGKGIPHAEVRARINATLRAVS